MNKKTYCVNVHYDAVVSVEVEATDENSALEKAEMIADGIDLNKFDLYFSDSCVTDVKE